MWLALSLSIGSLSHELSLSLAHREIEGESVFVGLGGLCQGAPRPLRVPKVVVRRLKMYLVN